MDSKKIGEFIKSKRVEARMDISELATKMHVRDSVISNWENGKSIPNVEHLEPLSRILGVSIAEILSGEKPAKELDLLLKELENKKRRKIRNFVIGLFICLLLCFLEVILYVLNVDSKYGYLIMSAVIVLLLALDIINYYKNK